VELASIGNRQFVPRMLRAGCPIPAALTSCDKPGAGGSATSGNSLPPPPRLPCLPGAAVYFVGGASRSEASFSGDLDEAGALEQAQNGASVEERHCRDGPRGGTRRVFRARNSPWSR